MAVTQSDAINWLNSTVGQHLDYDGKYNQQCFDYFNFYYQHITGENPYSLGYALPSAKDIWNVSDSRFTKIPDSNGLLPQPGDIAVYGGAWGYGNGHVEVVLSTDGSGCYFIGENEHNNKYEGVVQVYRTWSQMRGLLGVMRPNWASDAPAAPIFTVVDNYPTGKLVELNKQPTNLWGMNYANPGSQPPVEVHNASEVWTVTNKVHHQNGYDYYRRDGQVDGFNVLDCNDYVPPAPVVPYVPPAAPVKGNLATKYVVDTTVMYFDTSLEARTHQNAKGTIAPGTYYSFDVDSQATQLGTDNMKALYWINVEDNQVKAEPQKEVVAAKPAASISSNIKDLFTPFPDGKSRRYVAQVDMYLFDLAQIDPKGININAGDTIPIFGYVTKDSAIWLIPRLGDDTIDGQVAPKAHYYGIPATSVYTGLPNMKSEQYINALAQAENENREYRKFKHHETTADKVYYAEQLIKRAVNEGVQFFDIINIKKIAAFLKGRKG